MEMGDYGVLEIFFTHFSVFNLSPVAGKEVVFASHRPSLAMGEAKQSPESPQV